MPADDSDSRHSEIDPIWAAVAVPGVPLEPLERIRGERFIARLYSNAIPNKSLSSAGGGEGEHGSSPTPPHPVGAGAAGGGGALPNHGPTGGGAQTGHSSEQSAPSLSAFSSSAHSPGLLCCSTKPMSTRRQMSRGSRPVVVAFALAAAAMAAAAAVAASWPALYVAYPASCSLAFAAQPMQPPCSAAASAARRAASAAACAGSSQTRSIARWRDAFALSVASGRA